MLTIRARLTLKHRSKEDAEQASRALEDCGFGVLHSTENAVRFEGSVELFEKVFEVDVDTDGKTYRLNSIPRLPRKLAESASSVYIPTPPEYP